MYFMERNIGFKVAWPGWGMNANYALDTSKPSVSGELNDVTVAQALDYIEQTFPGFWMYENCPRKGRSPSSFARIQNRSATPPSENKMIFG
jgi:hypothetical protein